MSRNRRKRLARRYGLRASPLAIAFAVACAPLASTGDEVSSLPGQDAPSRVEIAPPGEPGEPLVVRGRVFAPDGQTPVGGVVLYVYHTDEQGLYAPRGRTTPRLRGWMRTDADGRYEYRTIRPASYPGRSTPAHIHAFLWGAGYPPQWTDSLLFADDPLLDLEPRNDALVGVRFDPVCAPLRMPEGELQCTRNYRLKTTGDPFSSEIQHAFQEIEGD